MAIKMSSSLVSLSSKTSLYPKTLSLSSFKPTKATSPPLKLSISSSCLLDSPKLIINNHYKPKVKKKEKKKTEVYALGRYIPISTNKARRVIDQIRGRSYEDTVMILELMPYRACYSILKLVCSAAANASYVMGSKETDLVISKAEVDQGTMVKKLMPRAKGRSYPIRRHSCHITIGVQDITLDEITTYKTESET